VPPISDSEVICGPMTRPATLSSSATSSSNSTDFQQQQPPAHRFVWQIVVSLQMFKRLKTAKVLRSKEYNFVKYQDSHMKSANMSAYEREIR